MNAHQTAGHAAAAARLVPATPAMPSSPRNGLEYGWQTMTVTCDRSVSNGFATHMANTVNKRQPRRLGQRST